jgi:hypothetical protein
MTTYTQPRKPAGRFDGGQFMGHPKDESAGSLGDMLSEPVAPLSERASSEPEEVGASDLLVSSNVMSLKPSPRTGSLPRRWIVKMIGFTGKSAVATLVWLEGLERLQGIGDLRLPLPIALLLGILSVVLGEWASERS